MTRRRPFKPPSGWTVFWAVFVALALSYLFQDVLKIASGRFDVWDVLDVFVQIGVFLLARYFFRLARRRERRSELLDPPPPAFVWAMLLLNIGFAAGSWL